jgi:hypothetical protein
MLFRSLTLLPLLALTAQGFLLPPPTQGEAEGFGTVNPVVNTHLLKLDCPGCLFAESDGSGKGYHWDEDVENFLVGFHLCSRFRFIGPRNALELH